MEKIRKKIIINNNSFFFDADDILTISPYNPFKNSVGTYEMLFSFNSKTKNVILDSCIQNDPHAWNYSHRSDVETNIPYLITYYSMKDERKLKLEKINSI